MAEAPGRVNLIGEHTDYNDGWVLPMAIERYVRVAAAGRPDTTIRAFSAVFGEVRETRIEDLQEARGGGWFAYVCGMAWAMLHAGIELGGLDLLIDGDVPLGSGLSSSAALEMATARAICAISGHTWEPKRMARLGQKAENEFVGVACGLMDQLTSAAAEEGCALLLDCRSLETEAVPFPEEARVVVMDTGSRRTLARSAYNDRRASCERAVEVLRAADPGVKALRDVEMDELESARDRMDELTFRRAAHVVAENRRPESLVEALVDGDLPRAGLLMNESHASLRDLYEVSSRELDLITELAVRHPACHGARLTGAGFGGCAIALVGADGAEAFVSEVSSAYLSRVDLPGGLFACRPVAGARLVGERTEAREAPPWS